MIASDRATRPLVFLLTLSLSVGCVSRSYVDRKIELSEARLKEEIDQVETQVEETQTTFDERIVSIEGTAEPVVDNTQVLGGLAEADRQCALQALARANSAGQLSEGRITQVISLGHTTVAFPSGKSSLSQDGRLAIDGAFSRLAASGLEGLVIEVQGHTDTTGDKEVNRDLGMRRARSVATHLQEERGFPGDRLRVISYGETAPIEPDDTADGRAANRRVTLVALR